MRLRVGEKIGLGFGLVGAIFLGVLWFYHVSHDEIIADYRDLNQTYGARQVAAFAIESRLTAMRAAADRFSLTREETFAQEALRQADALRQQTEQLARVDQASRQTAEQIRALTDGFALRLEDMLEAWRIRGLDEASGLQGAFREAAHILEEQAGQYGSQHASQQGAEQLQLTLLQLRRREKDYLLRADTRYVDMVDGIAADFRQQLRGLDLAAPARERLEALLTGYLDDFHALVEQDRRIARLSAEMSQAATRITPVVEVNLVQASGAMARRSAEIAEGAAAQARWSLGVAVAAALFGALLAVLITIGIVRPVRAMAGLLDRLTRESPRERVPADPDGRDEINAMAMALNTLADHRARLVDWWRSSMQEATAARELGQAQTGDERVAAAQAMHAAAHERLRQLDAVREQLLADAQRIEQIAAQLNGDDADRQHAARLRDAAGDLRRLLGVVAGDVSPA
ncbi:hypothetical protein [Thiohalocapsa marina]|uniref:hypothetical protein n=1 Tax=Thiohalocapsa marina TaxID=424902 RepID=UPI0014789E47|nr:hypothetical protein [Thiohalocapsa marina]